MIIKKSGPVSMQRLWLGGVTSLLLACSGVDPGSEGQDFAEGDAATDASSGAEALGSTQSALAQQSCLPSAPNYYYVGASYDALTGTKESFPWVRESINAANTCEEPWKFDASTRQQWITNSYELEENVESGFRVDGAFSGWGIDVQGSVSSSLKSKTTFSTNEVSLLVEEKMLRTRVTMGYDAYPNAEWIDRFYSGDNGVRLHNDYGDAYLKTADLGHKIYILFSAKYQRGTKWKETDFRVALDAKYKHASGASASLSASGYSTSQLNEILQQMQISMTARVVSGEAVQLPSLSIDTVWQSLQAYRNVANNPNSKVAVIGGELESFTSRYGTWGLFDWASRIETVRWLQSIKSHAQMIVASNTSAFGIGGMAADLIGRVDRDLPQLQNPTGAAMATSGEYYFNTFGDMWGKWGQYRGNQEQSYRLRAARSTSFCIGAPGDTTPALGGVLVVEPCSGADDQLLRWNGESQLRTVNDLCVGVGGGANKTNARLVYEACSSADSDQRWNYDGVDHVKVDTFTTRYVSRWDNVAGGYLYADSLSEGQAVKAQGWSRGNYVRFDWSQTK